MTKIDVFKSWLERDFGSKDVLHVILDTERGIDNTGVEIPDDVDAERPPEVQLFRIFLYTATNRYSIVAKTREGGSNYLGCIAQSRKARTGEDWVRGNDLPDGNLSWKTWQQILLSILRYELQTIQRKDLKDMAA